MVVESFKGPSSYATGGVWLFSTILKRIERATALQGTGGYTCAVVTGSVRSGMTTGGNAFQLAIYTGSREPSAAVDLSAQSFSVLLEGL